MRAYGNVGTGSVYNTERPDLPRATHTRTTHRPWCVDCKRKHDADQLDHEQRCERCARAAVVRAEQAQRRAAEEAERRARTPAPAPTPTPAPQRVTTPRRPASRRVPGTRTGPVKVRRTIDNTTRIAKLEDRRTRLRAQLADVEADLAALRREDGTTRTITRRTIPTGSDRATRRDKLDLPAQQIIDAFRAGATYSQLAEEHGCTPPTIRRVLLEHHEPTRDKRITYTPELLGAVHTRYVELGMSRAEVAADLELTEKVVATALERAGVTARPAIARTPADHAADLKARLRALGVTSRDVKTWAHERGLVDKIKVGIPSAALVDAYAAAHTEGATP